MGAPKTPDSELQRIVDAYQTCGSEHATAQALGMNRNTLRSQLDIARDKGIKPRGEKSDSVDGLKREVKRLSNELKIANSERADLAAIKEIIGTADLEVSELDIPAWTAKLPKHKTAPGVPTVFLSDFHWGERVFKSQVNGVNEYDLTIAKRRLRHTVETAAYLSSLLDPDMAYPGLVMPLGGDMVSGDIHDELKTTNALPTIPTVIDLYGELCGVIDFALTKFPAVFLPCVSGNHGRNTHKIYAKNRNHTSFDWMLYQWLAKHYANDKRVTFFVPDGSDAYYKVYNTRFGLTHGDQFRGGDGMIGALGPIIRGDHKKRSRNAQIKMEYDVLMMGHWHQYIHITRLIVNGSLKGYDEYAWSNNFGFELPAQAFFFTHPDQGINWRAPIWGEKGKKQPADAGWVSVPRV